MIHTKRYKGLLLLPLIAVLAGIFAAGCASMGRPEGGPRDVTPPAYVSSNPLPGQLNVDKRRIRIYFDENVQIKDAMSKVVVSPAQRTTPAVSAVGHYVQVDLRDTLLPNTTYTIDFSDAISDLNEGNVLDGFATDFSTGDVLDSLRISGMLFQASNLEPAQGMIVGVYRNLSDTAIRTLPLERISKTNQLGQFTIRNLSPGTYRIFAINDLNRDYHWDRSEDIAFYDTLITPSAKWVAVSDTLLSSTGEDSIVTRMTTAYSPDDIILTWFNEEYKPHYIAKYERPVRQKITLQLNAPSDTFPYLTVVGAGRFDGMESSLWSERVAVPTHDTLTYWITDTALANIDSLTLSVRHQFTDSADQIVWKNDTLRFFLRGNKSRKAELKREAEEAEKRLKALEKGDTLPEPKIPTVDVTLKTGSTVELNAPLTLSFSQPLLKWEPSAISMMQKIDTVWTPVPAPRFFFPNPDDRSVLRADMEWEPGGNYKLQLDSLSVIGALGHTNDTYRTEFNVKRPEDYSTMVFKLVGADSTAVVELLNNDNPIARVPVDTATMTATFGYIKPGTYYARLFLDRDGNGLYSTGSFTDSVQPEEVAYYPKKINLKKNWRVEQTWDIYELPLDQQKPLEIKKNKPKKKAGELPEEKRDGDEEDDDEYDNFGTGYGGSSNYNNRNDNFNRQTNSGRMR